VLLGARIDESGTQPPAKIMTMAGWVAEPEEWRRLGSAWRRMLRRRAYRNRQTGAPIAEVHAADMHARVRDFEGWLEADVNALRDDAAALLRRRVLCGVAVSVVREDYQRAIVAILPRGDNIFRDPYRFLMQACLEFICKSKQVAKRDHVHCVFDKGHPSPGLTEQYFYRLTDGESPIRRAGKIVRRYSTADSVDCAGLQAADLLAWGVRRGVADTLSGRTPDVTVVQHLATGDISITGRDYTYRDLVALRDRVDRVADAAARGEPEPWLTA
jgi:hypothetical protein